MQDLTFAEVQTRIRQQDRIAKYIIKQGETGTCIGQMADVLMIGDHVISARFNELKNLPFFRCDGELYRLEFVGDKRSWASGKTVEFWKAVKWTVSTAPKPTQMELF